MLNPRVEIKLFKRISDNTYETSPRPISNFNTLDIQKGIEARRDTFEFNLFPTQLNETQITNTGALAIKYDTDTLFSPGDTTPIRSGDRIKIYAWYGSKPLDFETDALLMDGIVQSVDLKVSNSKKEFKIKGVDRSELLLSALTPALMGVVSGSEIRQQVNDFIIELVQTANQFIGANSALQLSAALESNGGFIVDTRSDGTEFPTVSFNKGYRPLHQHIEELSLVSFTGDSDAGTYITSINNNNELAWKFKTYVALDAIVEDDYNDDSLRQDNNVINAYIINAGIVPDGSDAPTFVINAESFIKNGPKWKFIPMMDIAKEIIDKEINHGADRNSGESIQVDGFPSAYPWTMIGEDVTVNGALYIFNGVTAAVSNDREYSEKIKDQAIARAQEIGNDQLKMESENRRKFDKSVFPGANTYIPGNVTNIFYPLSNLSVNQRLVNVRHRFTITGGWTTLLQYEQDDKVELTEEKAVRL